VCSTSAVIVAICFGEVNESESINYVFLLNLGVNYQPR
jgi:hypothetical protein